MLDEFVIRVRPVMSSLHEAFRIEYCIDFLKNNYHT